MSDDETELELEHIAKVADVPDEMWAQFGPSATGIGWDSGFLGLALHLGSAADGPTPEEGAAWMMSDEGKRSRAARPTPGRPRTWRTAPTPTRPRAAADATYLLYTGAVRDGMPEA